MTDSNFMTLGRSAGSFLPPLLRRVRQELARRGAGDLATSTPASVDAELDEALRVLLGEGDTLPGQVLDRIKVLLSDPPVIFEDADARDWLRRDDVRALLKQATLALVTDAPLDAYVDGARRLYGVSSGDETLPGEPLFVYAVSFLALTLKAKVSLDARLLLSAGNHQVQRSGAQLERMERKIDELATTSGSSGTDPDAAGAPEERWLPITFNTDRGLAAALLGHMLGPGDVAACPHLIEADTLLVQLEAVGVARLAGVPGAGKSISMLQVAKTMTERGWRVVRLDDAHAPLPALIKTGQPVLHLIDDAHLVNPVQLRRLEEMCGATVWLLSAHTIASGKGAGRDTVYLDAQRAVQTIATSLEADLGRTFEEVRRLDDRIGLSMGDERLEDRLKAAAAAAYPWQFCFILSGGWRRARALSASARAVGADLTLAALAIRQLAARDARCSPDVAQSLLAGIEDEERSSAAMAWLLEQRLLLARDDLRCPHQRFGLLMIDEVIAGRDAGGRAPIRRLLERVLGDDGLPLAGFATLLHELRFARAENQHRGWSHLVGPDWLEPGLARCWKAETPLEIRDAAWFLAEIGAVHRDEKALFGERREIIANWIAACPLSACHALGNLANHIFNTDEALGGAVRGSIDPAIFARKIDAADARRTSEIFALASSLRVHWEAEGRAAFMAAFDRAEMTQLMAEWPRSVPLSFAADIAEFMVYTDEACGLDLVETLLGAVTPAIHADPIGAFHELHDIVSGALRLLDVLGIYTGKLAPNGRRKAIGRRYAAVFAQAPLAPAILTAKKRDYQSCAMLLSFLHDVAPQAYRAVVRTIDWAAINAMIGEDWARGGGDAEVLLGVAFDDPVARAAIRDIVAPNLHCMAVMPARLALMFPDLAIEQVDAGGLVGFDHRWEWAGFIVRHFASVRPDLLERLLDTPMAGIASNLSHRSPTYLNDILFPLRVIADVAPQAFDHMLGHVDATGAAVGWRDGLKGVNNNRMPGSRTQARETAAFLVEKSLERQDALGELARSLRSRYPRASVPAAATLNSAGPYDPIDHNR